MDALSVSAQLNRSTFFAGSFVYCEVVVRSRGFFVLEANLHGLQRSASTWVPEEVRGMPVGSRAAQLGFGNDCSAVLETTPTILGCEIRSDDTREHRYLYYVQLPRDLVPSFRGQALKYFYFISIAVTVGASEHRVLRLPFRVLRHSRVESLHLEDTLLEPLKLGRIHGTLTLTHPEDVFGFVELEDEVSRGRVYLARAQDDEIEPVEWALVLPPHHCPLSRDADFVQETSLGRAAVFFDKAVSSKRKYSICSGKDVVVEWHMDHSMLYLGNAVTGAFDFSQGRVYCHRLHVALKRREIVRDGSGKQVAMIDHVVDELDLDVYNALHVPVTLCFPDDYAQTFSTRYLSVRWVLQFVFFCSKELIDEENDDEILVHVPDEDLNRIQWELDVPVIVGAEMPHDLAEEPKPVVASIFIPG